MRNQIKDIKEVEDFWNNKPCGLSVAYATERKRDFFLRVEKERYTKHPKILNFANFASFKGKKILEIGCGIGTDGLQFAKAGAVYTGVDLTENAIKIAKEYFLTFGQSGELIKINAERLPFEDNYFDHIYSFGVIHHSPHPEKIVNEIYRVLKPGGTATVMLYNRSSFYYQIEVNIIRKFFFRFCEYEKFWKIILSIFGSRLSNKFEAYRQKLAKVKSVNSNPSEFEWVSMNTDDVFCPIARVYSAKEARALFKSFPSFSTDVWFIDKDNWLLGLLFGYFLPKKIENWLELKSGWFRMISVKKETGNEF